MDSDISPEIKTEWIPKEQRKSEINKLLLQTNLINIALKANEYGIGSTEVEEETNDFIERGIDKVTGNLTPEGEWAIKNLLNLGVLQYQEEEIGDTTGLKIEETGKVGEEIFTEVSLPIQAGQPGEKLVRIRIRGSERQLYDLDNRLAYNLRELWNMPEELISDYEKPKKSNLKQQLENLVGWDLQNLNTTETVLELIKEVCDKKTGSERGLYKTLESTLNSWQPWDKLGMDSGSVGSVFSRLEAEGILQDGINFTEGYLAEDEGGATAEIENGRYLINIKIPSRKIVNGKYGHFEIVLKGSVEECQELLEKYTNIKNRVEHWDRKFESGNIRIGEIFKLAREYGIMWDKKENK